MSGRTLHVNDADTGLVYMQQRYYDPIAGRFLSVDPVTTDAKTGDHFNRYNYADNNPYKFVDPDGRNPVIAAIVRVLLAIGGKEAAKSGAREGAKGAARAEGAAGKSHTTYTREKSDGTVYSGKTSGKGTPEEQVASRTSKPDHKAKTEEGYGPANVDKNSTNGDAVRGREQQLIEGNGGAQSQGGTSGNKINGVAADNPKAPVYQEAAKKEFGSK